MLLQLMYNVVGKRGHDCLTDCWQGDQEDIEVKLNRVDNCLRPSLTLDATPSNDKPVQRRKSNGRSDAGILFKSSKPIRNLSGGHLMPDKELEGFLTGERLSPLGDHANRPDRCDPQA